jgi:hypothetical protein
LDMPVRWNSTYDFLETALKMKESIKQLVVQDEDLHLYQFSRGSWDKIELIANFLKVRIRNLLQDIQRSNTDNGAINQSHLIPYLCPLQSPFRQC